MILQIPVFTADEAKEISEKLLAAEWINGKETAGLMGVKAKNNQQLSAENPVRIELAKIVLERLVATPLFMHAALPLSLSGINFNRYENGEQYGWHADNSFQGDVRADLSATLFLSDDYEGGELCFEDQKIKSLQEDQAKIKPQAKDYFATKTGYQKVLAGVGMFLSALYRLSSAVIPS